MNLQLTHQQTSQPTYFHVDINSYFATLLQQKYPELRGKPLGVVKDKGRTCLIATSKEAKKFGIKTGSMLKEARQLYPNIIVQPAEFDYYLEATRKLKQIFLNIVPDVYIYSLDEAFLNVGECQKYLYPNFYQLAKSIQSSIYDELGEWVTCNIGIARNRFLAKMASEVAPPASINWINEDNEEVLLSTTKFKDVCGIGFALEKKLHMMGITNLFQIRLMPYEELRNVFGDVWATELTTMAWGEEPSLLRQLDRDQPHMKSVGRSITGYKLCDNEEHIQAVLYNLTAEVTAKVRNMELAGRQVSIYLRGDNDQRWGNFVTLKQPIRHTSEMFHIIYDQMYQKWTRNFKVIKFAVRLSLLTPMNQEPLLPDWQRQNRLWNAIDKVNQKYGDYTLRSGLMKKKDIIYPEVTGFLGDAKYLGLR